MSKVHLYATVSRSTVTSLRRVKPATLEFHPPKGVLEVPAINDSQYQSLMSQLQVCRRRMDDQTKQAEHWRVQGKNAVGTDNIRHAQNQANQATADNSAWEEYDRLCREVNRIYGMGGHRFP